MNKQEGTSTKEHPNGRERRTKRSVLVTFAVLGGLVCLIGGTGLFAALQDSARSGPNSAESDAMAASADIQVATADLSTPTPACGTFSEDLTTPFHTLTGVAPGFNSNAQLYCVKNVGSQQVTLSALSDELTDFDYACTGDEALHGDTTCGLAVGGPGAGAPGPGELSSVLSVLYTQLDCATFNGPGAGMLLSDNAVIPRQLGTIAPGETRCFGTEMSYHVGVHGIAEVDVQRAQSDRATWRFRWVAQA
jgi:hypothetical protein